jgi:transposase InsO family protein
MDADVRKRLRWVRLYRETGDAGLVCRRCGISRPTLRKWLRRFDELGEAGLASRSRRPHGSPRRKLDDSHRRLILELRRERNLGARRIQSELRRDSAMRLSLATIHKVLARAAVKPLLRPARKKPVTRYAKLIPGERVQMDTCKVAPACYQYTAVDDCTRYRVLAVFSRRTAANTLAFLEQVVEEMPFPVQRVQTDRGTEFFAFVVQQWLRENCIKFRPVKPRSPHLNGKVERSQKTDLSEFWAITSPKDPQLDLKLADWQHYYNWQRPHGSLNGRAPMDVFFDRIKQTPFSDEVAARYDPNAKRIRDSNYRLDRQLARLAGDGRIAGAPPELSTAARVRVRRKRRPRAAVDKPAALPR